MIAIVTGGAGFIGSHLTELLLKKGFKVKVIDNLTGGRKSNIVKNLKNKNFYFDIKSLLHVSILLKTIKKIENRSFEA